MVDGDMAKEVNKELVKESDEGLALLVVVMVMVVEVIMKLLVVMEMVLDKEVDVEVNQDVDDEVANCVEKKVVNSFDIILMCEDGKPNQAHIVALAMSAG